MRRVIGLFGLVAAMLLLGGVARASSVFGPNISRYDPPGGPLSRAGNYDHGAAGNGASAVGTVPLWQGSYVGAGATWPTAMVGTDPALGSATTTVPVEIIPLRLVFASDGNVLDGGAFAQDIADSPLFQPFDYGPRIGVTQWADAFQRANFWPYVSTVSPDYHVLLGGPTVLPTVTLRVPAADGATIFWPPYQRLLGGIDASWLDTQLTELMGRLQIDPRTLPIFLTDNVLGVPPGVNIPACLQAQNCPAFGGYHGATVSANPLPRNAQNPALGLGQSRSLQTYIYASIEDSGVETPPGIDESAYAVSHEVMEWMDDPLLLLSKSAAGVLIGSAAPPWTSPFDPVCQVNLEVADPVAGVGLGVPEISGDLAVLADGAFRSWFAREQPSSAIGGRYDIAQVLTNVSTPCTP